MADENKLITRAETASFLTGITVNGTAVTVNDRVAEIQVGVLPAVSSSDNGKVLTVSGGTWQAVTPSMIYTGSGTPQQSLGNDGDIYFQS
jgi:hypothetical protein